MTEREGWGLSRKGLICYNKLMNEKTEFARSLRKQLTPQERILWQLLRNHSFYGYEFRRQYVIGEYIVDFVCREKKLL